MSRSAEARTDENGIFHRWKPTPKAPAPVPPPGYVAPSAAGTSQTQTVLAPMAMPMAMPVMTMPMAMPGMNMQMGMVGVPFNPMAMPNSTEVTEPPEEPVEPSNVLPMHGNTTTFNINNLLFNNVMENEYFKALYQLRTYHEVIDEIYRSVKHVEPWQTGTARFPSSAFCLLVKFMLMKLTKKQMQGLLATDDCAFVRAIGFIYLRYTAPPKDLWKWYEPCLEDEEEIYPSPDSTIKMTIGSFCTKLLTDMQYFGTTLPRIPVPIERKMKVMLLLLDEKKRRRTKNLRSQEDGKFRVGDKVKAIYSDDANEPAWYEAVIDSKDEDSENKYWVTFPEYGNTEHVDLGDMEVLPSSTKESSRSRSHSKSGHKRASSRSRDRGRDRDRDRERGRDRSRDRGRDRDRSKDRDRGRDRSKEKDRGRDRERDRSRRSSSRDRDRDRGRDRSRDRGEDGADNLLERVLASQREAVAAVGKNYGQRPTSYKGSLSMKTDRYTVRRNDLHDGESGPSRGGGGSRRRQRSGSRSPPPQSAASSHRAAENALKAVAQMKALKARYGDASASK